MTIAIREAATADYPAIYDLIQNELGYQDLDQAKFFQRMERIAEDVNYVTIAAELDGSIVGFLGLRRGIAYNLDGEYIQIIALAVSKQKQGHGIGTRLLAWAEAYGRKNGAVKFTLNSNMRRTDAHQFYERNGYQKSSFAFYKDP